jgi:hypothetical protein
MKYTGSEVKSLTAIMPQVASGEAAAINGPTIDRMGYQSAVVACQVGNSSGTPTRFGVTFKVQHKSGESAWADIASQTYTFSGETVATQNAIGEIDVDLRGCGRYVRCVATPTFTAGSTPLIQIGAIIVLGEAEVGPA